MRWSEPKNEIFQRFCTRFTPSSLVQSTLPMETLVPCGTKDDQNYELLENDEDVLAAISYTMNNPGHALAGFALLATGQAFALLGPLRTGLRSGRSSERVRSTEPTTKVATPQPS